MAFLVDCSVPVDRHGTEYYEHTYGTQPGVFEFNAFILCLKRF